eukprot:scaffold14504_cov102-Skeletonema_marinoi.AAC.5
MLLSSDATTYQNVEEEIDYDVLTVALNVHFYGDDSAGSALQVEDKNLGVDISEFHDQCRPKIRLEEGKQGSR